MERYTIFLDWKNQYCENDYTTQSNLRIQSNPYQITNGIFYRTRTKNLKICMETQSPQIAKAIFMEKNRAGGISFREKLSKTPWFPTILHSYDNRDIMVLAQK